jgi:hypothetical protein
MELLSCVLISVLLISFSDVTELGAPSCSVREQMGAASQMQQYLAGEGGEGGGHQVLTFLRPIFVRPSDMVDLLICGCDFLMITQRQQQKRAFLFQAAKSHAL